jgi:TPR repeat protein
MRESVDVQSIHIRYESTAVAFLPAAIQLNLKTKVVVSQVKMDRRVQLTPAMKELLTCPISGELMSDPVTLVPSGISYDRKSLCEYLLKNPSTDPSTKEDCGDKLQYAENYSARQVLTLYLGDAAFRKYDDSVFKLQYKSLWNVQVYESIVAFLYGMNKKHIDWAAAQETAQNADGDDTVILGFRALFLHPDVFPSSRLEKDKNKAQSEWRKAEDNGISALVDAGNAWAQWLQGIYLDIVEEEYDSAKKLYQLAAEQGHALAQCSLGVIFEEDEQFDMAEYYYELASEQGHALAQYNLAAMLFDGKDFDVIKPYLEKAALQGHKEAQLLLEKSESPREVAMEEGNQDNAQFSLDQLYFDGSDMDLDYQKATFEVAAGQGHVEALFNLGVLYEEDDQYDIAEEYYELASRQGHALACYNLAMLYEPDFERSKPYLEQAAAQGYVEALFYLGFIYVTSDIVEHDYELARYYLEQAAKQGHKDSQQVLYILYRDGLGVEQDMEKANQYFYVAFQSG